MSAALQVDDGGFGLGRDFNEFLEHLAVHRARKLGCAPPGHRLDVQHGVLQAAGHQLARHLLASLDEPAFFLLGHFEQRRAGNEDVPLLDELAHLAEEERQQQGANVLAVDVGIGEDDDLAVADLANVFDVFDVDADGGDERRNLLVLQQFLEPGFLDVEHLAAERENGLKLALAALLGAAAGGIALHQE